MTILRQRILKTIILCVIYGVTLHTQSDVQSVIHDKYSHVLDSLKSNKLNIKGQISAYAGYRFYDKNDPGAFDYRINANVNLSYKGIEIPLQYNFSNGRSISRFNGPNFRTPNFNILGVSPKVGWATFHLGDRSINFTRFTYDNLRFSGYGAELEPEGFDAKFFKGKIKVFSPGQLNFINNLDNQFDRKAWGLMVGLNKEHLKFHGTIFKADDDISTLTEVDTSLIKPKANTVLSLSGSYTWNEKLTVSGEQAISALTQNSFDPRIDIQTHQTVYNFLGLFEKKPSSIYRNAADYKLEYQISEYNIGLQFESIDKDYQSLGSLFYDNNHNTISITSAGKISEKINYTAKIGSRKNKEVSVENENKTRLVYQFNSNYILNDRISFTASYSNLKTAETLVFRSQNSSAVDSLSLSLVSSNLNIGSTIILDSLKTSLLSINFAHQNSNSIQRDLVELNNNTKSNILSFTYSKTAESKKYTSSVILADSRSDFFQNKSILTNASLENTISEVLSATHGLQYNFLIFNGQNTNQVSFNQGLIWQIAEQKNLTAEMELEMTDNEGSFSLFRIFGNVRFDMTF